MSSTFSVGAMNQLADALEKAGFTPEHITKLKQFKDLELIRDLLDGKATITTKAVETLIQHISSVTIHAQDRFFAKEGFKLKSDGGPCSYLGDNFEKWFLQGDGKVEEPIPEMVLDYAKLLRSSKDGSVITSLGGEKVVEAKLSSILCLMSQQEKGQDGTLITNGYANIFYVEDINGALRAVRVVWEGDGWGVSACSVEGPYGWLVGFRVFSRKSSEALKV